jgi:hypothetical protein
MRLIILIVIILFSLKSNSQVNQYQINARFDVIDKKIKIKQTLKFYNNSSKDLSFLILNDWANSYSNSKSSLGSRLSEEYSLLFQRSTKNQRGYTLIDKIYSGSKEFKYKRPKDKYDFIKIDLANKLRKGDSIQLNIDYDILIPDNSFTGYGINKSNEINIRDWYFTFSKIKNGNWIQESNLDLNDLSIDPGEFTFQLSYPKDFFLISNLDKQSLSEKSNFKKFISKKSIRKNSGIILTKKDNFKKYTLNNINIYSDFESFKEKEDSLLNKVFKYVDKKIGNKIPLNNTNINVIKTDSLLKRIFNYAENKLGKYRFNNIVISNFNRQRRPIYGLNNIPKIISPFNQSFLFEFNFLKEFLHTFLNETVSVQYREKYWEIEGIVIYLMIDYIETFYPDLKLIGKYSKLKLLKNRNYAKYGFNEQYRLFENIISSRNINQPVTTSLDSLTRVNQKIINPYKIGLGFKMLSEFLDKKVIDESIKDYINFNSLESFEQTSFQSILDLNTNNDTEWFFNEHLANKNLKDYSITKINQTEKKSYFKINKSLKSKIPIKISLIKNNDLKKEFWLNPHKLDTILVYHKNEFDFIEINKDKYVNESNYNNNLASFKKYKKPFKFVLFNDFDNVYNKQLNYIPQFGYNLYDGLMPGTSLTNITPIRKPFTYKLKPLYSFKKNKLLGSFNLKFIKYNENKKLFSTQYFLGGSTFHYKENLSYSSFFPSILLTFRKADLRSNFRQFLNLRYVSVYREENINQEKYPNYNILNAKYIITNSNAGKGYSISNDLQINKDFIKNSITLSYRNYYKDNRQYNLRLFIGKFIKNSTKDDYFSFSTYRARDYMFNYNLLGRSETTGFYSQQFISSEGALKSKVLTPYSNDWMISFNSGITIWQWVEAYYDLALIKNKKNNTKSVYGSGIRLNILTDYFELYFPFYSSLGNELNQSNYSEKIRFKISFDPNTLSGLFTRRWF